MNTRPRWRIQTVKRVMELIEAFVDPAADEIYPQTFAARVAIETAADERLEVWNEVPFGEPSRMPSREQCCEMFLELASRTVGEVAGSAMFDECSTSQPVPRRMRSWCSRRSPELNRKGGAATVWWRPLLCGVDYFLSVSSMISTMYGAITEREMRRSITIVPRPPSSTHRRTGSRSSSVRTTTPSAPIPRPIAAKSAARSA